MPMMDPKDIREMRVDDMKKRCREAFLAFELKEGLIEQRYEARCFHSFYLKIYFPRSMADEFQAPCSLSFCSDVGAIIRSLGINPSEEQVAGLLELVQAPGSADEETNVVRLDAFLEVSEQRRTLCANYVGGGVSCWEITKF